MTLIIVKLNLECNGRMNQFAQELLSTGQMIDCVLKSMSETEESSPEIACHSFVMSAYSPYLRQCFTRKINFEHTRLTVCLDLRTAIIQYVIKLIYSGECVVFESDILDLRLALAKLGIEHTLCQGQSAILEQDSMTNQLKRRLTSQPVNDGNFCHDLLNDNNDDKFKSKRTILPNLKPVDFQFEPIETKDYPEEESSRYTCPICKKIYQYDISLNKHMKTAHRNAQ